MIKRIFPLAVVAVTAACSRPTAMPSIAIEPSATIQEPTLTETVIEAAPSAPVPTVTPTHTFTPTPGITPTPSLTSPFDGVAEIYPVYGVIEGWGWPPGTELTLEVTSHDGMQKGGISLTTTENGELLWTNLDFDLEDGDFITIKLDGSQVQFPILLLEAVADPESNTIEGVAQPFAPVTAMVEHPAETYTFLETSADSEGNFSFDLSSSVDWDYGDHFSIGQYVHANGLIHVTGDSPQVRVIAPHAETDWFINESYRLVSPIRHFGAHGATGDFDRDGDIDVVIGHVDFRELAEHGREGPVLIFDNDGEGHFEDVTDERFFGEQIYTSARGVAVADLNGDGWLDVLIATEDLHSAPWTKYRDRVLINQGDGYFRDETDSHFPDAPAFSHGLCLGDVDNDNDTDVFFPFHEAPTGLVLNDGEGNFSISRDALPTDIVYNGLSCEFGDFDLDGDLDLFIGTDLEDVRNRLLTNDGTGRFTVATQTALPEKPGGYFDLPVQAAIADFNGDGLLDIVTANVNYVAPDTFEFLKPHHPRLNQLLINNGDGTFYDATSDMPQSLEGGATWDIAATDVDSDSDIDIIPANVNTTAGLVYLNDGQGHFEENLDTLLPPIPQSIDQNQILLFDMDGDSDKDVLILNYSGVHLVYRSKLADD